MRSKIAPSSTFRVTEYVQCKVSDICTKSGAIMERLPRRGSRILTTVTSDRRLISLSSECVEH
jgi:hypothetical protein